MYAKVCHLAILRESSFDVSFEFTALYPSDQTVGERWQNNTLIEIFSTLLGRNLDFISKLSSLTKLFFTSDKYGDHVRLLSTVTPSKRDF